MINLYNSPKVQAGNPYITNKKPDFGKTQTKVENQEIVVLSPTFVDRMVAQKFKNMADKCSDENNKNMAVLYYEHAIAKSPGYAEPYYSLAHLHKEMGNPDKAITTYKKLIDVKPKELEARTLMGLCYKDKKDYKTAQQIFAKATEIDPKYDFATRNLKETEYLIILDKDPQKAELLKQQTATATINKSINLAKKHARSTLTENIPNLDIGFNQTGEMSGHRNIAQYEDKKKSITITSDYIWAAPEVITAYLIHELVHAKDNDGLSSKREEQDAYAESIKFWINHNNGIKDPELDYAADLYRENPQTLGDKVWQTYTDRDPSMPEFSPHHHPDDIGMAASIGLKLSSMKYQVLSMMHLK